MIGYKGALLLDLACAPSLTGAFNVSNVPNSDLDRGDRYQIDTRKFIPSANKVNDLRSVLWVGGRPQ